MRSRIVPAVAMGVIALVLAQAAPGLAGARAQTHEPPYKAGAQGGDSANFIYSDPSTGRVGILRLYPGYNPFTCTDSKGGFVTLRLTHQVTGPIRSVEVRYEDAAVDPYAFLTAAVRQGDRYLGSLTVRGPVSGSGKLMVPLSLGKAMRGSPITVDFGAEVSSGCPNADGVMARYTEVVVHGA
jgi:hypothetical protein